MQVRSLTLSGFKSFVKEQEFTFPQVGLYLLSGDNKVESDLGANGSGKSSFWDALSWCLYGKSARGLKGPSLASWGGENICSVVVEMEVGEGEVKLQRSWNPNSLSICIAEEDWKVITQDELDEILGMGYQAFLNTVLLGQFNQMFFDLSPSEKLQAFSEVMDLDIWMEMSTKARQESNKAGSEVVSRLPAPGPRQDVDPNTLPIPVPRYGQGAGARQNHGLLDGDEKTGC